ncbi:MAG: porin family protein [Acidobacteria bacterium]|nr:porin family protein [Acidobacteriota bacterium]
MKIRSVIFITIVLLVFAASNIFAGKLKVGGKASTYNPPGADNSTYMIEVTANYSISDYFSAQGSIGWTTYKSGGEDVTQIPVTLDGIYHIFGRKTFDPYAGAGIGYYITKVGSENESTFGFQVFGGLEFRPSSDFGVSVEVKYRVPDISNPDQGGVSFGGGVTGEIELDL